MCATAVFPLLVFANRLVSAPFQILLLAFMLSMSNTSGFPFWTIFFFCFRQRLIGDKAYGSAELPYG
jgi:hypothetical protein